MLWCTCVVVLFNFFVGFPGVGACFYSRCVFSDLFFLPKATRLFLFHNQLPIPGGQHRGNWFRLERLVFAKRAASNARVLEVSPRAVFANLLAGYLPVLKGKPYKGGGLCEWFSLSNIPSGVTLQDGYYTVAKFIVCLTETYGNACEPLPPPTERSVVFLVFRWQASMPPRRTCWFAPVRRRRE